MVDDLRGRGVMTGLVRTAKGVSTGAAYITVTPDGENTIVLDPGPTHCGGSARGTMHS
jgi:ribokinase